MKQRNDTGQTVLFPSLNREVPAGAIVEDLDVLLPGFTDLTPKKKTTTPDPAPADTPAAETASTDQATAATTTPEV